MSVSTRVGVLAVLALLAAGLPPAGAQTGPAGAAAPATAPAMKEVQVGDKSFARGAPVPEWVENVAIPAPQRKGATVTRLADTQFWIDQDATVFVHRALQANDASTLKKIGEFSIPFFPDYQRLALHRVVVWRGGERLDRTEAANLRFLQPDTELANSVYTSTVVAAIVLADVRVGDTVEFAYTIHGRNPVFGDKFFDVASWDGEDPVDLRRVVFSAPASRTIAWRSIGDAGASVPEPAESVVAGRRRLVFEQRSLEPVTIDPLTPNSYAPARWLQFSESKAWSEVDAWAMALFAPRPPESPEFTALVERLRQAPSPQAQLVDALAFTQREIRYFSLSFGESSHRPADPDLVLQRRFGDCKDKSYLLLALLRALGIESHPVLLSTARKGRYDQLLPSPLTFDHAIVQARIDGHDYFVDPTQFEQAGRIDRIGQAHEGTEVLVVAADTRGPATIPLSDIDLHTSERRDEAVLEKLDGDAELVSRQWFTGVRAALVRVLLRRLEGKQFEKDYLRAFEQEYPGASSTEPPQIEDDGELNRILITTHLHVPGLGRKGAGGWTITFHPDNLVGVVRGQVSTRRTMPLLLAPYPYVAHYTFQLDLPEEVAAVRDPSTREADGPYFHYAIKRSFRGRRAVVEMTYRSLAGEVGAKQVADYVADVRKLDDVARSVVLVGPEDLKKKGFLGIGEKSLQDTLAARMRDSIEKLTATIKSGNLAESDLAHAYCDRGAARRALGEAQEGMQDANQAVVLAPNDPEMLSCRAEAHFDAGDFQRAADEASRAVRLGGNAPALRQRGLARFYLKQYAEAADDFVRAAAQEKDASARSYAEVWAIASYRRADRPLPEDLARRAGAQPRGDWPLPALAMLADSLSAEDLLKIVGAKSGDELAMTQTEAYFYLGQRYLAEGKRANAREAFEKVRALGVLPYIEYSAARFELQDLASP